MTHGSRFQVSGVRFQEKEFGRHGQSTWCIAHKVNNLICNLSHDASMLRAMLFALSQRPETSDQGPVAIDLTPEH